MRLCLVAAIFAVFAGTADAQVAVYVETTAKDALGKRLDYEIKDQLRASNSLRLTYVETEAVIKVKFVTLDPDKTLNGAGTRTIYSFNILLANAAGLDYFYRSFVGFCGSDVLASCGKNISEEVGVAVEELRDAALQVTAKKPFDSPP